MSTTAQQPVFQAAAPPYQTMAVNKVVASKGWFIAKIVLGSVIIVFDIVMIGVSAAFVSLYPSSDLAWINFCVSFCPAIVSFGWQVAEFITVCVHRDHRGIHPGAHVGLHLVLWLGFLSTLSLVAVLLASQLGCDSYCLRSYGYSSYMRSSFDFVISLENTELAFAVLLAKLHFILFVRFCIECNRRNRMPQGMVMVAAPGVQAPVTYYVPGAQPQYVVAAQPLGPATAMPPPPLQQSHNPHNSVYSGYYSVGSQQAEAKVPEPHPSASPIPAMSEVSGDNTPHPNNTPAVLH